MKKWQKIVKWTFWGVFLTWNAVLLFIILGKKDQPKTAAPKEDQQSLVACKNSVESAKMADFTKPNKEITTLETAQSKYEFSEAKLQKVVLKNYKADQKTDEKLTILGQNSGLHESISDSSKTEQNGEFLQIQWSGNTQTPDENTKWAKQTTNSKTTFFWTNSEKITFIQTWEIDQNYGVKIDLTILNRSGRTINVTPTMEMRKNEFEKHQSFIFSGISIYSDKKLHNLAPESSNNRQLSTQNDSWAAFNEKYWLIACTKPEFATVSYEKNNNLKSGSNVILYKSNEISINNGDQKNTKFNLYIGPKEVKNLRQFSQNYQIPNIENAIDYGWLFFLTKPVNYILNLLIDKVASIALALIILTVLLKLLTWHLTSKSHITMNKINQLTPAINELKHRLKDNPQLMNQEIFALYKKNHVNPLSGCLPSILQMLLLFPLYKVLSFSIDMRFASFPGWISDLSSCDPTSWINLFGLLPFSAPDFLHIGAWPVLMGISMIFQQKLTTSTAAQTPDQKFMLYGMPIFFTWMMANLATGVVVYWTLTNVLTIAQIAWITRSERKQKV